MMLKQILPLLITIFFSSATTAQLKNNATVFYKAGLDYKNKNMFREAMDAFNKAITLDKKYDSAYVEMGQIHLRTNNPDLAIVNFNKAISVNPKMADAYIALGKLYRDVKPNYDSAIICFTAAIAIDSINKETFYSIAWCYNAKGEYDRAIPYGIKALEIDNTYRPAYSELGHAYRRLEKYAEAIAQFKKNIAISPVDLAMLYSGYCYIELKDKEGAMQQYEALNKINEKMAAALKRVIDNMK
jgi:tetratricopeptide (TPR) repeat protein